MEDSQTNLMSPVNLLKVDQKKNNFLKLPSSQEECHQ
jgi:hypothetical protein